MKTKNDIRVKSWAELKQVLYAIPKTKHERYRSNFVYRGVADSGWKLETSLQRLGKHGPDIEGPLLRNFVKYAQTGEVPSTSIWFRLALAQHHGLPTRVLDWSVAPNIAVHFATAEEEHYDKDAAIWCVDVDAVGNLLPTKLQDILKQESAFVFSVEMLESINSLSAFDEMAADGPFPLLFEPPSLDSRIINQGAMLSVMPGAGLDLTGLLLKHPTLYKRIIIPKRLKWEIRDKLDQDNVTERMLFPGLDGLSRWLKRYYGPGPTAKLKSRKGQAAITPRIPNSPTKP